MISPIVPYAVGSVVSGIADYFGGREERDYIRQLRELQKRFYSQLEYEKNQPGITDADISGAGSFVNKAIQPKINKFAESFSQRLGGTNSGQFKGALGQYGVGSYADRIAGLKTNAVRFNAERPLRILEMMSRTGAGGVT